MHRRLLALVTAAALAGGCFYSQAQSPKLHDHAYVADLILVGLAVGLAFVPCGEDGDVFCEDKLHAAEVGLAIGVAGLIVNRAMAAPAAGPPDPTRLDDDALDRMAAQAAASAHAGRCDDVRTAMRALFEQDRGYFDQVSSSDPAIVTCLR